LLISEAHGILSNDTGFVHLELLQYGPIQTHRQADKSEHIPLN